MSLRLLCLSALLLALLSLAAAQTNLIQNGDFETGSFAPWTTPLGVNDTGLGAANRLRVFSYKNLNGGNTAAPNGWAYSGQYSVLWESSTLNQSIQQTVAVTGGTQYLLSFFVDFNDGDTTAYLQVSAQFNDGSAPVVLLTPSGQGAQQGFCSGSQKSYPPFWWSQFTFTVTAPTAASSMNLTFYGYDSEYGFLVDAVTMYAASGNSQPAAPPALPVVPAGNLLQNGNFETGSVQPWREAGGDNPYGLSGNAYAGEGAYDFAGFAGNSGIPCPEGNYCFTFGAPAFSLPIQQTITVPSGTTASYSLSFQWYSPGGYNASNPSDLGSALIVGAAWNTASSTATSGNILWATYNTTAVTTATSPSTATVTIGAPPSGTTSLTLQMQGFFYATYYVVDYIQLQASGVTQAQSPQVYTCGQTTSALSLGSGSSPSTPSSGAASQLTSGAVAAALVVSAASALLLL